MLPDELTVPDNHAAVVLGPWPVRQGVDHDVTDLPRPELQGRRRKAKIGVDLALGEKLHHHVVGMYDELDVFARIHAHVRRHAGEDQVLHGSGPEFEDGHRLSLQVANGADSVGPEQLRATDVARPQDDDRISLVHVDEVSPDEVQGYVRFTGGK
jgi:hypothetical protein